MAKKELTQEELLEQQAAMAAEGEADGAQEDVDQEDGAAQGEGTVGDQESAEEEEEALDLDWKGARARLKAADEAVSWSIDDFETRSALNALKDRYNAKERTASLYNAIEGLKFNV